MKVIAINLITVFTVVLFSSVTASAQTTAFNFQGNLNNGGTPANGNFEMQFKLFDALAAGAQIGGTLTNGSVAVINGSFAATLDFGAAAFNGGPARYLEIAVRPMGNPNPFTLLSPRKTINSTPYSIPAKNASQLGGFAACVYVTTTSVGNTFIKNDTVQQTANFNISGNGIVGGNLGIGTTPSASIKLDVNGDTVIRTSGSGGNIQFGTPSTETGMSIIGTKRADIRFDGLTLKLLAGLGTTAPANGIAINTAGNVGIGTFTPGNKLDVVGSTLFTTGGTGGSLLFHTPGGESGMSIVGTNRADIRFDGTTLKLLAGTGTGSMASTNGINVNASGNVGIGTTAPVAKLHAETSVANTAAVYGNATGSGGVGVYGQSTLGAAVHAEGNAVQAHDKGGFVKAMIYVNADATIIRCYNGVTGSSTGNCGFSVGQGTSQNHDVRFIDFGFQVNDRFVSVTPERNLLVNIGATFYFVSNLPNRLAVDTFITDVDYLDSSALQPVMIIVY
jgi:hypothetical protein